MKLGACLHLEEGSVGGVNIFLSFLVQLLFCEKYLGPVVQSKASLA